MTKETKESCQLTSYCLVIFCVLKLGLGQTFLKLLEPLNLLQMSVLCDIFSPGDVITCDLLIGRGQSQGVCIYQAWGEQLQKWLGWKLLLAWGCSVCNCCDSCLELFAYIFYILTAFLTAVLPLHLEISLFCLKQGSQMPSSWCLSAGCVGRMHTYSHSVAVIGGVQLWFNSE